MPSQPGDQSPLPAPSPVRPRCARALPESTRATVETLLPTLATHSWALLSTPTERDAAFARIRAHLAGHPATAGGEFTSPLVIDVLRATGRD